MPCIHIKERRQARKNAGGKRKEEKTKIEIQRKKKPVNF